MVRYHQTRAGRRGHDGQNGRAMARTTYTKGPTMATETYELIVRGQLAYEPNAVVMHFQSDNVTANETLANGESLLASWANNVESLFLGCLPPDYFMDRITARRVGPGHSAVAHVQSDFDNNSGTLGNPSQSTQMCPSIFLVPPIGTKSGGRVFMPGVGSDQILNNAYTGGYLSAIHAFMNAQIVNFGVSGAHWQQVIFSRKHLTSVHVMAYQLSPVIGFQRRRRSPV